MGIGEQFHGPLRKIYIKIRLTNPTVRPQHILKIAVKASNDNMNENGLVPSKLVFGTISQFSNLGTDISV